MISTHDSCNQTPCPNCHNHFLQLKSNIERVITTKHFEKDVKDKEKIKYVENEVLKCDNSMDLHKFEEHVKGVPIFRAKINSVHYVFSINENEIIFMRAFHNFNEYKDFLSDEKKILNALPV